FLAQRPRQLRGCLRRRGVAVALAVGRVGGRRRRRQVRRDSLSGGSHGRRPCVKTVTAFVTKESRARGDRRYPDVAHAIAEVRSGVMIKGIAPESCGSRPRSNSAVTIPSTRKE